MKMIGFNKNDCNKHLQLYRDKMEKILSLVEGNLPLYGTDKEKAQSLLKDLKQSLESDLGKNSKGSRQNQISSFERDYYLPAIFEATKRISAEPELSTSQEWIDNIDMAQKYIKFYLNQLLSARN
jgi:hypothetical protein